MAKRTAPSESAWRAGGLPTPTADNVALAVLVRGSVGLELGVAQWSFDDGQWWVYMPGDQYEHTADNVAWWSYLGELFPVEVSEDEVFRLVSA